MSDRRREMMGTTKILPAWPDSEIDVQYNGEGKYQPYFSNCSSTDTYRYMLSVHKEYVCGAKKICIYVPNDEQYFFVTIQVKDSSSYNSGNVICLPAKRLFSYDLDKEEYSTFSTNNYYNGYYYNSLYVQPEYTYKYVIPLQESVIEALNDYEGSVFYMHFYFDYFSLSSGQVGISMQK